MKRISPEDRLFEVADRQQGHFTSQQAEECGIPRSNFHFRLHSGEWVREQRGIYRLARYPMTERPELVLWSLWSKNKKGVPQGVWSHQTALDIYELSDIMPAKMHMTVPLNFRRQKAVPKILKLHFEDLSPSDIENWQGYQVTTPLRTLMDIIEEGITSEDQILQAVQEAMSKGMLTSQDLNTPLLRKYKDLYGNKI